MEKCLPFKSFTGALFFLALLFIMYDPPEIHSQCIDVSSSPCYVNISDIPYEMFKGTVYDGRKKEFFEKIFEESIYVDTCNIDWENGDIFLYYKNFYFSFNHDEFYKEYNIGNLFTKDDIKDEFTNLKSVLSELEKITCKYHFEILLKEESSYFVKLIFEKHKIEYDIWKFFYDQEISYDYHYYGGLKVEYLVADVDNQNIFSNISIFNKNNILEIKTNDLIIEGNIIIYDYLGTKQIETKIKSNETNIDISSLSRGIYFVRINNKIYKFMKE